MTPADAEMGKHTDTEVYVTIGGETDVYQHLEVLTQAAKLGHVTVGLLTDEAIALHSHLPCTELNLRWQLASQLRPVARVVQQDSADPTDVLKRLKPRIFVDHDCARGAKAHSCDVGELLSQWGGRVVKVTTTGENKIKKDDVHVHKQHNCSNHNNHHNNNINNKDCAPLDGDSSLSNHPGKSGLESSVESESGPHHPQHNNNNNGNNSSAEKEDAADDHRAQRTLEDAPPSTNGKRAREASGLCSSSLRPKPRHIHVTPWERQQKLRSLLRAKECVRVMEAHNGLTGLVVENARVITDGQDCQFDAVWCSSLTTSLAKGKPDTEVVDVSARVAVLNDVLEACSKPVIYDGDTGGEPENFWFTVRTLERHGVSAVIIEDKVGLKRNSLFGTEADQLQASIPEFCHKIGVGKSAQITSEFMVIARVESLVLGRGQADALQRARAYVQAGADAIMIHSRSQDAAEVVEFCKAFRQLPIPPVPLVAVPSTYCSASEKQLSAAGFQIVIYANQLLRAAYPAMMDVATSILQHGRSLEAEKSMMSIADVIRLVPEGAAVP